MEAESFAKDIAAEFGVNVLRGPEGVGVVQEKRGARRAPVSRVKRPKRVALIKEKRRREKATATQTARGRRVPSFYSPSVGAYEASEVGWQWVGALEKGTGKWEG